jgi:hypothetical protein
MTHVHACRLPGKEGVRRLELKLLGRDAILSMVLIGVTPSEKAIDIVHFAAERSDLPR